MIDKSNVRASINGSIYVGGAAGYNQEDATIRRSWSGDAVTGSVSVGGLGGFNEGVIKRGFAVGDVTGTELRTGGLVGVNREGTITNSFAAGAVTGESSVGGVVGLNFEGTVSKSYWDVEATGQTESAGSATGLTTAEMTGSAADQNMNGLDFNAHWTTVVAGDSIQPTPESDGYPILSALNTSRQLEAQNSTASETADDETGKGDAPEDPTQRALQIAGKSDPSDLTQNDVTAVITRFNRGQSVNNIDIKQDDVTAMITLFERN
jgi:hypothetical protein